MMTVDQLKSYKKFIEESLKGYANDPNPLNKQFNENMIKHNKAKLETINFILEEKEYYSTVDIVDEPPIEFRQF
tara:strand:+ start:914 stop:1135 length:222 start_codon:yes stop_codon:yes gene_type:complete